MMWKTVNGRGGKFRVVRILSNLRHTHTHTHTLHGNHKPKICNRYTHKEEKGIQTERESSNHKKRATEEMNKKRTITTTHKQLTKWKHVNMYQ